MVQVKIVVSREISYEYTLSGKISLSLPQCDTQIHCIKINHISVSISCSTP